ncbi:hypothetical protein JCM10207_000797 [Rhodosporidiobolus poonsookiae]
MEVDMQRLEGDAGFTNEVLHCFKDALVSVIKAHKEAPGSDDSIEIISGGGKKRAAPDTPAGAASPKKAARRPTALPVLDLHLTFSPTNDGDVFARALSSVPGAQAPTPLAPVVLSTLRDSTKAPHRLYLRHAETNAALVEFDPLDPAASSITAPWTQMIAPPPLTQAGKPFKPRARKLAARAPRGEAKAVVPTGAGGLLDALAYLDDLDGEGVKLRTTFSAELVSPLGEAPRVIFHLDLAVLLSPKKFFTSLYSRSKRLVVHRILPAPPVPGAPREAGIDYFYASLQRAPRTADGVPVAPAPAEVGEAMQVDEPPEESDEDRAARLRREAKGKGRAVSPPPPEQEEPHGAETGAYEGPEDDPLFPPGLTVELMPFQARSVRWMLAREGKRVVPLPSSDSDSDSHDHDHDKAHPEPHLADVDAASLKAMKRGPLWEEVVLRVLPRAAQGETEPSERALWLNRVNLQISEVDPVDAAEEAEMMAKEKARRADEQARAVKGEEAVDGDGDVVIVEAGPAPAPAGRGTRVNYAEIEEDDIEGVGRSKRKAKGKAKALLDEMSDDEERAEGKAAAEVKEAGEVVGGQEGHGLLAEEVGLGKTVEVLSLILLHTDPKRRRLPAYFNPVADAQVQPSGLTLIICPTAIVGQWETEIARLTPGLRVLRYEGIKQLDERWTTAYITKKFDVVLTTFDVLRKEVAFARKPAQRGLRNKREIRYRRSMLVEIDFLRVCMDEAQMVGDAVGPTSETASLISRRFSWAVTSTPLRDKIADIKPLLTFLRVEPIASGRTGLQRLLEEVGSFKRLFNEIGARTLKSQVTHELTLPPQLRFVAPIDLTAVEKYYYEQRYAQALQALGLDEDGTPYDTGVDPDTGEQLQWVPDKAEMNRWLTILRQLAIHPQLAQEGRQHLGRVLKTVEEVYAAMQEQAVSAIQSDQRALLAARTKRGQYQMWDEAVEDRFQPALELFKSVVDEIDPLIVSVAKEIHSVWQGRATNKERSPDSPAEGLAGALELGFRSEEHEEHELLTDKERALARSLGALKNRLRDLLLVKHSALFFQGHANYNAKREEEEKAAYAQAEALRQTILAPYERAVDKAQTTLKDQLDARDENDGPLEVDDFEFSFNEKGHGLLAIAVFNNIEATSDVANGYAELIFSYRQSIIDMMQTSVTIAGENATGEEYEERAELQQKLEVYLEAFTVLVGEWSYIVNGARSALADQYKAEAWAYLGRQEVLPQLPPPAGGIEPDDLPDDAGEALKEAVDAIGRRLGGRRAGSGEAEDEEEDEEEEVEEDDDAGDYQDGKGKGKGKAVAKGKGKKKKEKKQKTRFQERRTANKKQLSYKEFLAPTIESGHQPADVLRYELLVERLESKGEDREFFEPTPIRHLIKTLKERSEETESAKEEAIMNRERARLSALIGGLEKVADRLRAELEDLNKAFNVRLNYYRNLQAISDEVADPDMGAKNWAGLENEIAALRADENDLALSIAAKQTRRRYLDSLNNPDEVDEEERTCPICADFFHQGILTNCAHLTCANCFRRWYAQSHTCALCKAKLQTGSYQAVKYRAKAAEPAQPIETGGDGKPREKYVDSQGVSHEFDIPPPPVRKLDENEIERMKGIATAAPLSSKSDFIVKAIKTLRRKDVTAKVVIFSAWVEALNLLQEAFTRNGVKYVRLEGANGKGKKEGVVKRFAEDPDVAAFFLHTRSQSAGLNLTVARYVFLVEPLLHPSLELQAVARVHRIGQRNNTIVYQFVASDTVDERVSELRARQGTSLFLEDAQANASKESFLGQQKDRASAESRKAAKTSDEAIDDEDDIARCLLSPEAFTGLQRALLPFRLRGEEGAFRAAPRAPAHAHHAAIRSDRFEEEPAAMAGIAAVGRAALAEEEQGPVASPALPSLFYPPFLPARPVDFASVPELAERLPHHGIPPEVVDDILEYVKDDVPTLVGCCRASKGLSARTVPHLYRNLEILYLSTTRSFGRKHVTEYNLSRASATLVDALYVNPALGKYCRKLRIEHRPKQVEDMVRLRTGPTVESLKEIFERMPYLQELWAPTLGDVGWGAYDYLRPALTGALPSLGGPLKSLRKLKIPALDDSVFPWLLSNPNLVGLEVDTASTKHPPPATPLPPFSLTEISFLEVDERLFAYGLSNSHLSLTHLTAPHDFPFAALLAPFSNLVTLAVTFYNYYDNIGVEDLKTFLRLDNRLRTLKLQQEPGDSPQLGRISLIGALPPQLHTLILQPFEMWPPETRVHIRSWPATLRRVTWTAGKHGTAWTADERETVEEACRAKGVEVVEFWVPESCKVRE